MAHDPRIIELLARRAADPTADLSSLCAGHPELLLPLERVARFEDGVERLLAAFEPAPETAAPAGTPTWAGPLVKGYRILRLLAEGGMGRVYLAFDPRLKREVALKLIRPDRMSAVLRSRFEAEAQAVARLDHANIVKVYEVGEAPPPEGGEAVPYLAMEYAPGGTLEERAGKKPMPAAEAARLAHLLARAMAHAHSRGVVHRDLKPGNVLVAPLADQPALNAGMGCPKVTDFGLARQDRDRPGITSPGTVIGTPEYMAPEQAEGKADVGPAADVWALGMILYRLLTGRVAFAGESAVSTLHQVCNAAPTPPRELAAEVPAELEAVCLRCLSKNAQDRPTAAQLAAALDGGEPLSAAPPRLGLRGVLAGTAAGLALLAAVVWTMRPSKPRQEGPKPASLAGKRLWLECLRVEGGRSHLLGTVSGALEENSVFSLPFGTPVFVHVEFAAPAHAYLVAFNADGTQRLLWPVDEAKKPDESVPPPRTGRLKYPDRIGPKGLPVALSLDEEPRGGLQAFAAVVSDAPLPPYAEWKNRRLPPWTRIAGVANPFLADAKGVYPVLPGKGLVRGENEVGEGPDLLPLAKALADGADLVEILAVPVEAKR